MLMPSVWNPFKDLELWKEDDFFPAANEMKSDIKELDDHFEIAVDVPGFSKEDIKAELRDGLLTISATKSQEHEEKDKEGRFIRQERRVGSCSRSFRVGKSCNPEDIKAEFSNGVLHVTIPKEEEKEEEKKLIEIQ